MIMTCWLDLLAGALVVLMIFRASMLEYQVDIIGSVERFVQEVSYRQKNLTVSHSERLTRAGGIEFIVSKSCLNRMLNVIVFVKYSTYSLPYVEQSSGSRLNILFV